MLAIKNILLRIKVIKKNMVQMIGVMVVKKSISSSSDNYYVSIGDQRFEITPIVGGSINFNSFRYQFFLYNVVIDCKCFYEAAIHNPVYFVLEGEGVSKKHKMPYNSLIMSKCHWYPHGRILIDKNKNTSFYFRRARGGNVYLSVRKINITDGWFENLKVSSAYYVSLLVKLAVRSKSLPILIYEKESSKYEESASVIYEAMIEKGIRNAYFILSEYGVEKYNVDERFRHQVIIRNSFRHYLYFFLSNIFISTEAPGHSIELRIANNYAVRKLMKKSFRYFFLQHGVTYMVSLSSRTRRAFRSGIGIYPKSTKIVVSSQLEAEHFVEHGGYELSDLYITGLPKFDRAKRYPSADKIIIMPTWRLWEYNQIRTNAKESGYYKMIELILSSIPDRHRNNILLLPHPLFRDALADSDFNQYIDNDITYDEALKNCRVLITDYSSISYDAFYRGADVAFWWADKDACMQEYGGEIMLNESNAFGPVAYSVDELKSKVTSFFTEDNRALYEARFKQIVEFDDGKNTDRLISCLERDGVI